MTTTFAPPPSSPTPRPAPRDEGHGRRWRSRGIRQGWVLAGSVLTVVMLLFTAVQVVSLLARETTTVVDEISATDLAGVTIIELHGESGSVSITGTDRTGVRLQAEEQRGLVSPRNEWQIEGDRLVIRSECPPVLNQFCSVDHDIEVPAGMKVVLDVDHGRTVVTDVDGAVTVRHDHGNLELVRVAGPVDVRSRHGQLRGVQLSAPVATADTEHGRVALEFVESPLRVRIASEFGDVDVAVPDVPGTYAVTTSTEFGRATNALRTDPLSDSSIDVTVEFGRVTLGYLP